MYRKAQGDLRGVASSNEGRGQYRAGTTICRYGDAFVCIVNGADAGKDKRTIERDASRGEALGDDLDKGVELVRSAAWNIDRRAKLRSCWRPEAYSKSTRQNANAPSSVIGNQAIVAST